jgi:hypothetical protein
MFGNHSSYPHTIPAALPAFSLFMVYLTTLYTPQALQHGIAASVMNNESGMTRTEAATH